MRAPMNFKNFYSIFFILVSGLSHTAYCYDLNLLGFLSDIHSISRHTTSFIDCLPDDIEIKLFQTKQCSPRDLKPAHKKVLHESINIEDKNHVSNLVKKGLVLSGITIYTDSQWYDNSWKNYKLIPNKSILKYAYCVTERSEIQRSLVSKLNSNFDAVIVVDEWFVDVCKKSGVTIPVFALPLALDLNSLLSKPIKEKPEKNFVFGFSGLFWPRKNHELLMRAFHMEFKNNPHVKLIMQGRFEQKFKLIKKDSQRLSNKNITLIQKGLNRQEYEDFLTSLHCYTILSKGEGFSITPREALAAGIPCVISNNTAHKIICKSGLVYAVPSNIKEPSFCYTDNCYLGHEFNCTIKDVRKALRAVYKKYEHYQQKALLGREWVKQYLAENLAPKYLNLIKPKRVVFGPKNKITDEYLMTNSKALFDKYRTLCKSMDTKFEVFK